jgi:hypothetical protein
MILGGFVPSKNDRIIASNANQFVYSINSVYIFDFNKTKIGKKQKIGIFDSKVNSDGEMISGALPDEEKDEKKKKQNPSSSSKKSKKEEKEDKKKAEKEEKEDKKKAEKEEKGMKKEKKDKKDNKKEDKVIYRLILRHLFFNKLTSHEYPLCLTSNHKLSLSLSLLCYH